MTETDNMDDKISNDSLCELRLEGKNVNYLYIVDFVTWEPNLIALKD